MMSDENDVGREMLEDESDHSDPEFVCSDVEETDSSESDSDSSVDEELEQRLELEIENYVAHFTDEHPMRHNACPESDEDSEEEVEVVANRREHIRVIRRRGDGNLQLGKVFCSGLAFKEAVLDYALNTGRNIKQNRYDKTKLGYECGMAGCKWRIYCALNRKKNMWKVTVYPRTDHTCTRNGECLMLTDPVIAHLFLDKIRQDNVMPMKIQEMIKDQWKLIATRDQCQEARKKTLKWIKKEHEDQFAHIRGYCKEITNSNEDSKVEIETIPGPDDKELFDRFYVCFNILRRTWKATCRPIIGVDGTFLKGTIKGQLLTAIGRDPYNKIYPIAWVVVQVENENNWFWFIQRIKADLDLKNGEGFIIVSDRQKGLIKAVAKELPNVEHRKCLRHIYGNLKANHGKKMEMKMFIWQLAWSYNATQYEKNLERLREYDLDVYNDVMKSNPKSWCRAFYKIDGKCCQDVDNNSAESFNNSIGKAREKPMMSMLETIRRLAMVRISTRSREAEDHPGKFTPYVQEFLDEEHEDASKCTIYPGTSGMFEVYLNGDSERVDMRNKTCTCCKWEICGIPCEHAYGVILNKKLNSDDYVSHWFLTSRWRETYADSIIPLRAPGYWARGDISLVSEPPEPPQPGRKKKSKKQKRIKGVNESPSKKKTKKKKKKRIPENENEEVKKRTIHCKNCGGAGHNSRSCAKRAKRTKHIFGESSGSQATQPMSQVVDE